MVSGRIKVVARAQKTATLAEVRAFMIDTVDTANQPRVLSKMSPHFHNFELLDLGPEDTESRMDVTLWQPPDIWQLYPKVGWMGDLKQNRDLDTIMAEAEQDVADGFTQLLEANGFTVLDMVVG